LALTALAGCSTDSSGGTDGPTRTALDSATRIQFDEGGVSKSVSGTVDDGVEVEYNFYAFEDQRATVTATGPVKVDMYRPGGAQEVADVTEYEFELGATGDYLVVVRPDTDASGEYTITLEIP